MRILLSVAAILFSCLSVAQPNQTLTPGQYKTLNEIQDHLAEQEYIEAKNKLDKFQNKLEPSFALALAYQLSGQLLLLQEKPEQGLEYFKKTLALGLLEPAQEAGIATTAAQIQLSLNRPDAAYTELEPRLIKLLEVEKQIRQERKEKNKGKADHGYKPVEIVNAQSMATLATASQLRKDYASSIPWLNKALKRSEKSQENWLLMLMVAYYQTQQYQNAANTLDDLQRVNPKKEEYWVQQAAMYQLLNNNKLALRSLETGYAAGYVTQPNNVMQLIQLLINQNLPERGARILQQQIENNSIEITESNWRLLTAAWMQSRDRLKAAQTLRLANKDLKDGKLLYRAAQLHSQDARHNDALKDAQDALRKGLEDKEKAQALMLAATSAYELKDLATARRYFQQALAYPDTASNAKSWLDYISSQEEYL